MWCHIVHFYKILRSKVWRICSQILDRVIILHENARPHTATLVTTVFQEYGWEVLNHPPYSLDPSPLDYDLFPKLKEWLWGICFNDLSKLSSAVIKVIQQLNKNQLLQGIEGLPGRWRACILHDEDYVEGL